MRILDPLGEGGGSARRGGVRWGSWGLVGLFMARSRKDFSWYGDGTSVGSDCGFNFGDVGGKLASVVDGFTDDAPPCLFGDEGVDAFAVSRDACDGVKAL